MIDYRMYSQKALLRFDLEVAIEAMRRHRAWLSLCESAGEYEMSEKIRETVKREQAHVIDLAATLGEFTPDELELNIRPRSRRVSRFSDT